MEKIKNGRKDRKRSIRFSLMIIPITLVVFAILGIVLNVAWRTDSSIKNQMRVDTELLLANVVARLEDNNDYVMENGNKEMLTDEYFHQEIIEDLSASNEVVYANFIDTDYISIANNDPSYLGHDMSNTPEIVESVNEESIISKEHEVDGVTVYDIIYPVTISGENAGTLRMGFSIDEVNRIILNSIISTSLIGLLVLTIIVFVLYQSSNDIITIVDTLQNDVEMMEDGDFSQDLSVEFLERKDEFGEIAQAVMGMKESIRDILHNVTQRAEVVAAHSQELTATANQSALASDELASVVEEVAATSNSQATDVGQGATAVQELDRMMGLNSQNIDILNQSTDEVNTLKDEGVELILDLVDKTEETRGAIQEIASVIDDTNTSADNIVKAIGMIESLSAQVNLLSLNATIEAARAGEAGAGFAVVAEEIRKLAEDSDSFTGEIEEILNDLTSKTSGAVETMAIVNEMIDLQGDSVDRTDAKFEGISLSLEQIQTAINEVNNSNNQMTEQEKELGDIIENLAAIAEQNAAGTQEASASVEEQNAVMAEISNASEELAKTAEELNNAVSVFTF